MKNRCLPPIGVICGLLLVMLSWAPVNAYDGKVVKAKRATPEENSGPRSLNLAPFQMPNAKPIEGGTSISKRQMVLSSRPSVLPSPIGVGKKVPTIDPHQQKWEVWINDTNDTPILLKAMEKTAAAKIAVGKKSGEEVILDFIEANAGLFNLKQPRRELTVERKNTDSMGREHVVFAQHFKGIPVWGAALVAHLDGAGGLSAVNGRYNPTPDDLESIVPAMPEGRAVERALSDYGTDRLQELSEDVKQMLGYDGPQAELNIWNQPTTNKPHLVWKVELRPNTVERWRYFIDTKGGEILEKYQYSPNDGAARSTGIGADGRDRSLNTFQYRDKYTLVDVTNNPLGVDMNNVRVGLNGGLTKNARLLTLWDRTSQFDPQRGGLKWIWSDNISFDDSVAVTAHANLRTIFDYFFKVHGRNSIDGEGGDVVSAIRNAGWDFDKDGKSDGADNAMWNGVFMQFGIGTKNRPMSNALDITAHEWTHGIINKTANLEYKFQSGALNESFSDVFGAMIDTKDWTMGEDVISPGNPRKPRNLQDPNNGGKSPRDIGIGWRPGHMDEFLDLTIDQDNGGVHYNSSITNHAAYLIAEAIGRPKTERLYYHILVNYLTPTSQFIDCRLFAEVAANDLYPGDDQVMRAVENAFAAVGIGEAAEEVADDDDSSSPAVERSSWVATVGAGANGENTLWIVKPANDLSRQEHSSQLTSTQVFTETGNAVTAPLDGRFLLFIDSDNNLRYIGTDGEGEEVINADGDWGSIALSPDGKKLAATTVYEDSTIFFFDLENSDGNKSIHLYHPTTSGGGAIIDATRYADALQWDATGTFVVFDSYNSLTSVDNQTIDFWDIKEITPDTEIIVPKTPPLPPGYHFANPSLSTGIVDGKMNDCLLLYEVVNDNKGQTAIVVFDRCNGEGAGIVAYRGEDLYTFPRFINNDNEIVFEYWTPKNDIYTANLYRLPLSENRLSRTGDPVVFLAERQSPYAFSIEDEKGFLVTAVQNGVDASQPVSYTLVENYPNPFNPETVISYQLPDPGDVTLEIFDINGQRVTTLVEEFRQAGAYEVQWRGENAKGHPVATGVYFYKLEHVGLSGDSDRFMGKMLLLR